MSAFDRSPPRRPVQRPDFKRNIPSPATPAVGAVPLELRSLLAELEQGHLLEHVDEGHTSVEETKSLVEQLSRLNLSAAVEIYRATTTPVSSPSKMLSFSSFFGSSRDKLEPVEAVAHLADATEEERDSWGSAGFDAIRAGKVAAVVLGGGQGTRLGFSGPKGMYDFGMPSGKTLFQLMAERLVRLKYLCKQRYKDDGMPSIPFLVMTSPLNHATTQSFFEENQFFGLPAEDVRFFAQGTLPCFSKDGKIILESKASVSTAPNGNGGFYPALRDAGLVVELEARGVEYIHVFSVDNALAKPADPNFMGFCVIQNADCGNEVVWKRDAEEKVGVVASRGGKPCIVEYSEISDADRQKVGEDGKLVYGAGNICNHFFSLRFIQEEVLPNLENMYHVAKKKIPAYDLASESTITPTEPNGIKLESFIFDCFPRSQSMAILGVDRENYFSPVKNAPGSAKDSPDTARLALSEQAKSWVRKAGIEIIEGEGLCEISPLVSFDGEGILEFVPEQLTARVPFVWEVDASQKRRKSCVVM